jgi:hypothetical protein
MSNHSKHINEENLSIAWARAFVEVMRHTEITPLTITVTGLDNGNIKEDSTIRYMLDTSLSETNHCSCESAAGTIFPLSLWNRKREADFLFRRYENCRKQIRKCPPNRNGVYFERLIAYGIDYSEPVNQLEYIIETYTKKDNHRRSALYASILDPRCDDKHQKQRGFPCLQQVGFVPVNKKFLNIVGFYPMEYIYGRGYGNYLGLCRLGQFMAQEMGLTLSQMTCFIGVSRYGSSKKIKKTALRNLEKNIKAYIEEYERVRGKND